MLQSVERRLDRANFDREPKAKNLKASTGWSTERLALAGTPPASRSAIDERFISRYPLSVDALGLSGRLRGSGVGSVRLVGWTIGRDGDTQIGKNGERWFAWGGDNGMSQKRRGEEWRVETSILVSFQADSV